LLVSEEPFIRRPRWGDGKRLVELADMALHGNGDEEYVLKLVRQAEESHQEDVVEIRTTKGPVPVVSSVRVMDRGDGQVVGFSYGCPPMDWILKFSAAPSFGVAKRIAAALSEIQMVAVLPRYRGRGFGRRLMADCEDRYRAAGYRALLVTVENRPSYLREWYESQYYWFSQPEEPYHLRYWKNREVDGLFGAITPTQRMGFKALVPGVEVADAIVDAPLWRRERRVRSLARGTTVSGLFPDPTERKVQPLAQVSGLLG
jgi:ribosomal protein S18 acetylase RimI-like enzyme